MSQIALADTVTNASPHTAPAGNKIKSNNKKVGRFFLGISYVTGLQHKEVKSPFRPG